MTLEDLKNYTVAIRRPAQITYRGYKLTSCSAPSSGEVVLAAMKTAWGDRLTTVFVRQGHYARDPGLVAASPPADIVIETIGDLLGGLAGDGSAAPMAVRDADRGV